MTDTKIYSITVGIKQNISGRKQKSIVGDESFISVISKQINKIHE